MRLGTEAGGLASLRGLMANETNYDTIFGRMVVEQGLCTNAELRRSLEELQSRRKINPLILKDLMVDLGYITSTQAERLKTSKRKARPLHTRFRAIKYSAKSAPVQWQSCIRPGS